MVSKNFTGTEKTKTMITLEDIKKIKQTEPPRLVIYGPPGVGKTSLANEFPAPIFLQTEDGISHGMELDTFGLIKSWSEVYDALKALAGDGHDYQTLVLDSLDALEPLIWADVCERNGWNSLKDAGYGEGYLAADELWRFFFNCINHLRSAHSMSAILIGHSHIINLPNPVGAEFPRWDFRLHKRAHGIVEDSVDAILMVDYDAATQEVKGKGGAKTTKSTNSTVRYIHANGSPARNAKNRYGMPDKMLYQKGQGFGRLAQYLPGAPTINHTETDNEESEE
jgi:GTPase SAR1 family protein